MQIFRKKRGAVSVFLVIILVPIITLSCIFVDVSRMKLAESVVDSAGDLTLNTILSQYDGNLNDFYGLMASSQSIDDFLKNVEDYYVASMTSQGITTSDAKKYANDLMSIFGKGDDSKITDLLQISVENDSFKAEKVENGSLANPALMKTQIVEFMKYRSPINKGIEIFQKLKSAQKDIEGAEDDSDLIAKKQKFYEAEGEISETAYEIYQLLKKYEDVGLTKKYVKTMKENLKSYKKEYKKIHTDIIKDQYNTQKLNVFNKEKFDISGTDSTYSDAKRASVEEVKKLIIETQKALGLYYIAEKTMATQFNTVFNEKESSYEVQYWVHANEEMKLAYDLYVKTAKDLCSSYKKLKNAQDFAEDDALNITIKLDPQDGITIQGEGTLIAIINSIDILVQKIKTEQFENDQYIYNKFCNDLNKVSTESKPKTNIENTSKKIAEIHSQITEYIDKVDTAKSLLTKAIKKAKKLPGLVKDYEKKKQKWKNQANSYDSTLAKNDREEIESLEEENITFITSKKVNDFVNRLKDTKSFLGQYDTGFGEYKYNGKNLKDLSNYNIVKNAVGISFGEKIPYNNKELEKYVNEKFNFEESQKIAKVNITKKNSPDIKSTVSETSLYKWIQKRFADVDDVQMEQGKEAYKKEKKKGEFSKDDIDVEAIINNMKDIKVFYDSGILSTERPSKSGSNAKNDEKVNFKNGISGAAKFISSLFGDLGNTLKSVAVTMRDDIYTTDYIMSMFSYDTYENEAKYNIYKDKGEEKDIKLTNYIEKYKYGSVDNVFRSTEMKDRYNKSLTNKIISADNNFSYGNEVEYILYGDTNMENKLQSYGSVFAIRLGFNLITDTMRYGKYDPKLLDNLSLNTLANSISVLTYGIIPSMLVKIAVIIALAVAETFMDLQYLKAGIPVMLFKGKDDLFIKFGEGDSVEGNIKSSKFVSNNESKGIKMQYSDYLTFFLFMNLLNTEKANCIYARTADVIETNMKQTTSNNGYSILKSQVYFQVNATAKVKPLMLELPINASSWNKDNMQWCIYQYNGIQGY